MQQPQEKEEEEGAAGGTKPRRVTAATLKAQLRAQQLTEVDVITNELEKEVKKTGKLNRMVYTTRNRYNITQDVVDELRAREFVVCPTVGGTGTSCKCLPVQCKSLSDCITIRIDNPTPPASADVPT